MFILHKYKDWVFSPGESQGKGWGYLQNLLEMWCHFLTIVGVGRKDDFEQLLVPSWILSRTSI